MRKMLLEDTEEQLHLLAAVPVRWDQDGTDLSTSALHIGVLRTQKVKASPFRNLPVGI